MTTPDHTTGAELQTLREASGLSRELFAALVDVEARTVKHWETRKGSSVPADAAALVRRLVRWVIEASEAGARQVREATRTQGAPAEVVLIRYREAAHMAAADRAGGMLPEVHAAMIARLVLQLMAQAVPVRVVWFEPEAFEAWSKAQGTKPAPDTPATRAAWAAHAIERQAIPHPGDQPPTSHTPGA